MSKQFKRLLLIVMLVVCFSMQLGTEASAGFPTFFNFSPPYPCGSICIDCILKKLGNVDKNYTTASFLLVNPAVYYEIRNNGGNSSTSNGIHNAELTVGTTAAITKDAVDNGTADVRLELTDGILDFYIVPALLAAGIPPNHNWTLESYFILSFTLRLELDREGEPQHIIEALCTWNETTQEYDVLVTCDSQDGPPCPA